MVDFCNLNQLLVALQLYPYAVFLKHVEGTSGTGAAMRPAIAIGANIYRLRMESHLTQDDLACRLGVTKASVSK